MSDANKRKMIEEQTLKAKFDKLTWNKASRFDWKEIPNQMVRRHLKLLIANSKDSLPYDKYNEIYHLIAEMKEIYAHTRVCPYDYDGSYCDLELEPDVNRIMANSRNPSELLHVWKEWHNKIGPPMKNKFMRYVELANQAAKNNGFEDAGEEMRDVYDDPNFEHELAESFQKLQPLYKELFTYVRKKLIKQYGPNIIRHDGLIPAHLLGNIWAQEWSNIEEITIPYPNKGNIDITNELLRQGFTPLRMFQTAEEFFTSLGMKTMPPEFWSHSMFERPSDRKVQCTASAWDFCNRMDYRIKQCTDINMKDFISTHHEMAHIEYYLYYMEQPFLYQKGANPGFHEGIANAISLSVGNPYHLRSVGLLSNFTDNYEMNINYLFHMALKKVAYAPFAYLVDLWRYEIFRDGVETMNRDWWQLRVKFQGIVPPITRTEQHLDPAAKRHIPADIPYMQYYVALLLEFQIFEALCSLSGENRPLHTCDIYRSREAGRLLIDAMSLGRSRHWKEVIHTLTRGKQNKLSADSMIKYFDPLYVWLKVQNQGESIVGWMTKAEDSALYQPLVSSSNRIYLSAYILCITLAHF